MATALSLTLALACSNTPPAAAPVPAPAASTAAPSPAPAAAPSGTSVYSIGDLHGDLDNAISTLRIAGLVDAEGHWTGGTATLVQTGDVVDRGPDSRALMAWLRALGAEAKAAGGQLIPLLGNHEVMNVRGDWRYVAPEDIAAYGGEAQRRAAFAADGEDGRWLRTLDVAAKVGDTVFVHGGITPEHAKAGVAGMSEQMRTALDAPDSADAKAAHPVLGEEGPIWFRGYVQAPESDACPILARALEALDARRMVVGHTTRRDGRIEARCGGALLVGDIGIADGYGAHLGMVELRGGADAWAHYPGGPVDLPDPTR